MSMPSEWIDRLFHRLYITYGAAWMRMWEGIPIEDVKANWAQELAGFVRQPKAIAYALENLPADKPPTALVFRQICRLAPEPQGTKLLPLAKTRNPPRARELREMLGKLAKPEGGFAWAYALQEREKAGEVLTEAQRKAWREALAEAPMSMILGEFTAPPAAVLPPGMRA